MSLSLHFMRVFKRKGQCYHWLLYQPSPKSPIEDVVMKLLFWSCVFPLSISVGIVLITHWFSSVWPSSLLKMGLFILATLHNDLLSLWYWDLQLLHWQSSLIIRFLNVYPDELRSECSFYQSGNPFVVNQGSPIG